MEVLGPVRPGGRVRHWLQLLCCASGQRSAISAQQAVALVPRLPGLEIMAQMPRVKTCTHGFRGAAPCHAVGGETCTHASLKRARRRRLTRTLRHHCSQPPDRVLGGACATPLYWPRVGSSSGDQIHLHSCFTRATCTCPRMCFAPELSNAFITPIADFSAGARMQKRANLHLDPKAHPCGCDDNNTRRQRSGWHRNFNRGDYLWRRFQERGNRGNMACFF
jgi:hypothetical protein